MSYSSPIRRAEADKRAGKSPSTQAGEFVREEFHHIRQGKHGARSPQQAIAIGLSKARRAGVKLSPPTRGQSTKVRRQAARDYAKGQQNNARNGAGPRVSRRRSRATLAALKREGRSAAAPRAISRQTHSAGKTAAKRSAVASAAGRTGARKGGSSLAQKAMRTRNTYAHQK